MKSLIKISSFQFLTRLVHESNKQKKIPIVRTTKFHHHPSVKAQHIKDILICSLQLIIFCKEIFPPQARAIKTAQVPLSGPLIGDSNGPARVFHFTPYQNLKLTREREISAEIKAKC